MFPVEGLETQRCAAINHAGAREIILSGLCAAC
jgi:hypothetical protein